jgi:hypothetical protein
VGARKECEGNKMAIDESSPDLVRASAGGSGDTDELRDLLVGYASALETINDSPAILRTELERPRLLRWLRVPAAPRGLVRALFLHHLSRCVTALKCSVVRRAALDDDAAGPKRDLEMLERFEQSLPTTLRPALIWPLGLLGVLLVAYCLANFFRAGYSGMLGDLTTAAVNLNRTAAIAAFASAHRRAQVSGSPAMQSEMESYAGAAMIVSWSAVLVIVALLPAFAVKRQLLAQLSGLESRGFAALGARPVHDVELDLVAYFLQLPTVALTGVYAFMVVPKGTAAQVFFCALGVILLALTVLAGVELRARYATRRAGAQRRHGRTTRLSLRSASVLSLGILLALVGSGVENPGPKFFQTQVGNEGRFEAVNFSVTAIEPNAACHDPHRPLKPGQQFLRFDLEVWSTVDQFVDSGIASGLSLRHWNVANSHSVLEEEPLYMHTKCGDGTEAVSQPIIPGSHTKTVVVIDAPKPAAFLQLDVPNYAVWRWPIPAVW